jgi:hypothetical protein
MMVTLIVLESLMVQIRIVSSPTPIATRPGAKGQGHIQYTNPPRVGKTKVLFPGTCLSFSSLLSSFSVATPEVRITLLVIFLSCATVHTMGASSGSRQSVEFVLHAV